MHTHYALHPDTVGRVNPDKVTVTTTLLRRPLVGRARYLLTAKTAAGLDLHYLTWAGSVVKAEEVTRASSDREARCHAEDFRRELIGRLSDRSIPVAFGVRVTHGVLDLDDEVR